jgi:hypothetical protein
MVVSPQQQAPTTPCFVTMLVAPHSLRVRASFGRLRAESFGTQHGRRLHAYRPSRRNEARRERDDQ